MVTITLYMRQQKRHWCIEQSFGLCGRGWGWDDLGEWHWNMYNIIYGTSRQSRFDAQYWMLGAGAMGQPRGMVWGGRREEGSGWGTHVYLWRIHFDIWQNQYNIVKFKNKIKLNKQTNKQREATREFSSEGKGCGLISGFKRSTCLPCNRRAEVEERRPMEKLFSQPWWDSGDLLGRCSRRQVARGEI